LKARPSPKKKNSPVSLRLGITHTAASSGAVSERRLRRVARLALLAARGFKPRARQMPSANPAEGEGGRGARSPAVGRRGRFEIALAFVTDARMRRLNREFAGNDYVTDVLSFAAREDTGTFRVPPAGHSLLGDIVIALPQAARQAREAGHPLARELDLLVAHGVLHLLGYDHGVPADARRMKRLQAQILSSSRQKR
jgi:probable rRNA maturation factor